MIALSLAMAVQDVVIEERYRFDDYTVCLMREIDPGPYVEPVELQHRTAMQFCRSHALVAEAAAERAFLAWGVDGDLARTAAANARKNAERRVLERVMAAALEWEKALDVRSKE